MFGTEEAGRDRDRGDAMRVQVGRHGVREADHGVLRDVVEQIAAIPHGVAIGHLDDQPGVPLDHERDAVAAGDDVGVDGPLEEGLPLRDREFPEGRSPLGERIAAPDVVDQDVEAAGIRADAREERCNLFLDRVVRLYRDPAAPLGGDPFRGFLDRLGSSGRGGLSPDTASRAVDAGPRGPEHPCDPASGATGGAGHQSYLVPEGPVCHLDLLRAGITRTPRSGGFRSP